jgi:predicted PolB exonuclease-like 3'-5' exonuclease
MKKQPKAPLHLVLDLETIPDPEAPPPKSEKKTFPPPPCHQIVCASYLWLTAYRPVDHGVLQGDESTILRTLSDSLSSTDPVVVGFNSRGFDLPVIAARCVRHGIPLPWYYASKHPRYRYSDQSHIDIMDRLCDQGASPRASLDTWAKAIGLPGKTDMDGSLVEELYAKGETTSIGVYCLTDTMQTAGVFLRSELVHGNMSVAHYQAVSQELLAAFPESLRILTNEGRFCLLEETPMPTSLEAAE